MAYAGYRAYKSTSFIKTASALAGSFAANSDIGQSTLCAYTYAGGGKTEIWSQIGGFYGVAETYSRFGLKFNIDFAPMLGIQSAVLSLWSWNSGTITDNGVPTVGAVGTTLSIGRSIYDWAEHDPAYYHAGYGNYKYRLSRGTGPWGWGIGDQFADRGDHWVGDMGGNGTLHQFNVTGIVENWRLGNPNYGFILGAVGYDTVGSWTFARDHGMSFHSCQTQTNAGYVPLLEITYQDNTAPSAPIYLYPANDQIITTTAPTMGFTQNDSDANEYISGSGIQVFDDSLSQVQYNTYSYSWPGNNASFVYGTLPADIALPLVAGRYYRWRAMTRDKGNAWSPWSGWARFKINGNPFPPSISMTYSGQMNDMMTLNPTYSFAFADSDPYDVAMYGYRVVVSKPVPGTNSWVTVWDTGDVDISGAPVATKSVVSATLAWGTDYRVKARVRDSYGAWSSYTSPEVEFSTHRTQEPSTLDPHMELTGYTPTFTGQRYQAPDLITKYNIRVWNSTNPSEVKWDTTLNPLATGLTGGTDSSNGTDFTALYAGSALTAGVKYNWQCQIYSDIGAWSQWSAILEFTVYDPSTPTTVSPVGDQEYTPTPPITIRRSATFNRVQYQIYDEGYDSNNTDVDDAGTGAIYSSAYISTGIQSYAGPYTQYSETYAESPSSLIFAMIPAEWNGTDPRPGYYKIRARVSADAGANWTPWNGLQAWKTDSANVLTLVSVAGDTSPTIAWITDSTPDFIVQSASDTIDKVEINVYRATDIVMGQPLGLLQTKYWSSGFYDVPNGLTATIPFTGEGAESLVPGNRYAWNARMQEDTGARSDYSGFRYFRLNGPPYVPTQVFPQNGGVYDANVPFKIEALFDDPDRVDLHDYPTKWQVQIRYDSDDSYFAEEIITGGLVNGFNSMLWTGTPLNNETYYECRMRFVDSKNAPDVTDIYGPDKDVGWTSWNRFVRSTPPNGTISSPSNGSSVATVSPTIQFTYDGYDGLGTTHKLYHMFIVYQSDAYGNALWPIVQLGPEYNTSLSYSIPPGYLQNYGYYKIVLYVANDKGMVDPSPSEVDIRVMLDAPYAIEGFDTVAFPSQSRIGMAWRQTTLKADHTFIGYRVYRKKWYERKFREIAFLPNITWTGFNDWYAGNSIRYDYKVVAVTTKAGVGIYMESPDAANRGNQGQSQNESDNWTLVGADRSSGHIYDLTIIDENHTRPIQQEEFETLGADRKVIMRGFVLGHEGTLTTLWENQMEALAGDVQTMIPHTQTGRDLIDYVTFNPGPHIIKSPFGDVWDVQFTAPEYRWLPAGSLEVTLNYVETGSTSQEGES